MLDRGGYWESSSSLFPCFGISVGPYLYGDSGSSSYYWVR